MEPTLFHWSSSVLLLVFLAIAFVIPALIMYSDDDEQHHLH